MEEFRQAEQAFVGAFRNQTELKSLLMEAEEKFRHSKQVLPEYTHYRHTLEVMPEYIDYRVLLSAYNQSKEDYREAFNNFSEAILDCLANKK